MSFQPGVARTLASTKKNLKLCAGKRRGTVRVVDKFSKCNDLEFDVVLKKLEKSVNHKPTANDQTVSEPVLLYALKVPPALMANCNVLGARPTENPNPVVVSSLLSRVV